MAKEAPDRFTTNVRKAARTGKIFIDYLRHGEGASAAYSTRPGGDDTTDRKNDLPVENGYALP
jgi:DNA primase